MQEASQLSEAAKSPLDRSDTRTFISQSITNTIILGRSNIVYLVPNCENRLRNKFWRIGADGHYSMPISSSSPAFAAQQ